MTDISPDEDQIVGSWAEGDDSVAADENTRRIEQLIRLGRLVRVAESDDGWAILYRHVGDGRYWELTYPHSELAGGGPPLLKHIDNQEVKRRYRL